MEMNGKVFIKTTREIQSYSDGVRFLNAKNDDVL
jgi:hypothetical protein